MTSASRFSIARAEPPGVAVELAARYVSAASLDLRGGQPVLSAHATEPLPAGALMPSLTAANIIDRVAVSEALGRVLEKVGRPKRVGLIIPDPCAKVSFVRFEHVPARSQDLDQLIRWQVRKAAPFPIEEAQIGHVRGLRTDEGQEFIVTLAKRDVILEYEDCFRQPARMPDRTSARST
jgi:type IV pilus assembly protein PilM